MHTTVEAVPLSVGDDGHLTSTVQLAAWSDAEARMRAGGYRVLDTVVVPNGRDLPPTIRVTWGKP